MAAKPAKVLHLASPEYHYIGTVAEKRYESLLPYYEKVALPLDEPPCMCLRIEYPVGGYLNRKGGAKPAYAWW